MSALMMQDQDESWLRHWRFLEAELDRWLGR